MFLFFANICIYNDDDVLLFGKNTTCNQKFSNLFDTIPADTLEDIIFLDVKVTLSIYVPLDLG